MNRPSRARPITSWAGIAILGLVLCAWATSVVCIINRGGQRVDVLLADGALSFDWGSTTAHRRYWRDCRNTYRSHYLRDPNSRIRILFVDEFAAPAPLPVEWTFEKAPYSALVCPAFWTVKRLGLRAPSWELASPPVVTYNSAEIPLLWFAIPPAVWTFLQVIRRRRTRKPGHCITCGYDLTGNTSGVCSECGEKINAGQQAAPSAIRSEES